MDPAEEAGYTIERLDAAGVLTLRRALLSPAEPLEPAVHPADRDPDTVHFGAHRLGALVGIATIVPSPAPASGQSFEVVGVAVEHGHRGRGVGHRLLEACAEAAIGRGATSLTASVPARAHGFFDHEGFRRTGHPFEATDGTPHYRMERLLAPEAGHSGDRRE